MTQVLTISAQTAHYAADTHQKTQKVTRSSLAEEQTRALAELAQKSEDFSLRAMMTVIKPPALSLYWLTASTPRFEQATLTQAVEAYKAGQ
ncbi:hypothetical protein ACQQ2Q_10075 [Agrobacterium sp. ES01]|uniref:hypothetical protein n=1 Tax=Agrobacterium sp. ES01 TaxID=3420714 RepID=UPI003D0BB374